MRRPPNANPWFRSGGRRIAAPATGFRAMRASLLRRLRKRGRHEWRPYGVIAAPATGFRAMRASLLRRLRKRGRHEWRPYGVIAAPVTGFRAMRASLLRRLRKHGRHEWRPYEVIAAPATGFRAMRASPLRRAQAIPVPCSLHKKAQRPRNAGAAGVVQTYQIGIALFFLSSTLLSRPTCLAWRFWKNFSATCGNRA